MSKVLDYAEELKERIDTLKERRSMLAMKDHWSGEDFEYDIELLKEQKALEEEYEKLGGSLENE